MFEITVFPWWAVVLIFLVSLSGFAFAMLLEIIIRKVRNNKDGSNGLVVIPAIGIMLIMVFLSVSGAMTSKTTIDNPLDSKVSEIIESAYNYSVDQSNFEKIIADEIGAENIIINDHENETRTFYLLKEGDVIDFRGTKETSIIEGSVYFTKESMVIIVDTPNEVEDKIVVPTK